MHGRGWWHRRFTNHGIRMTQSREAIIDVLNGADGHLTAAEIYLKAHELNPAVGLTTVYRTLDILTEMGVVYKFEFGEGKARFELTGESTDRDHHHHLVCMKCKRIIDYSDMLGEERAFIEKIQAKLAERYDFEIRDHFLRFNGICGQCRNGSNNINFKED